MLECEPRTTHPYWGRTLTHLKGEITAINGDGTFEVKFHHPFDPIFEMGSNATMDVECSGYWVRDEQKERRIKVFCENAEVGDKVRVNEYKNLFYIYTKLHKPVGAIAWCSMRGDPHYGYKTKYSIDVGL